jgi:predicted GNAT family acetyltransferase
VVAADDAPVKAFVAKVKESMGDGAKVTAKRSRVGGMEATQVTIDTPGGGFATAVVYKSRGEGAKSEYTFQHHDTHLPDSEKGKGLGGKMVKALVDGYKAVGVKQVPIHVDTNPEFWNHMRKKHPGVFVD